MHLPPSSRAIKELQSAQNGFLRSVLRCGTGTSVNRMHWLTENELSMERMKRLLVKCWINASAVSNSRLSVNAEKQVNLPQRRAAKVFTWLMTITGEARRELVSTSAKTDAIRSLNKGMSQKRILYTMQGLRNANWLKLYLLGNLYMINQKRNDRTPFERLDLDNLCDMSMAQLTGWTLAGYGNEIGRSIHRVYSLMKKAD